MLFYGMGVEFKGRIFSDCSRRMKWQQGITAGIELSIFWIDHFVLSYWYSDVMVVGNSRR